MIFGILKILFFAILMGIIARKIGGRAPQPRQVPPLPYIVETRSSGPTTGSKSRNLPDQFYQVDTPAGTATWLYNPPYAKAHFVEMHPYGSC